MRTSVCLFAETATVAHSSKRKLILKHVFLNRTLCITSDYFPRKIPSPKYLCWDKPCGYTDERPEGHNHVSLSPNPHIETNVFIGSNAGEGKIDKSTAAGKVRVNSLFNKSFVLVISENMLRRNWVVHCQRQRACHFVVELCSLPSETADLSFSWLCASFLLIRGDYRELHIQATGPDRPGVSQSMWSCDSIWKACTLTPL